MSDAITSMVQAGAESALVQTGWAAAVSVSRGSEASERSRGSSNLSRSSAKSISIHSKGGAAEDPCGVRILDPLPPLLSKVCLAGQLGEDVTLIICNNIALLLHLAYSARGVRAGLAAPRLSGRHALVCTMFIIYPISIYVVSICTSSSNCIYMVALP